MQLDTDLQASKRGMAQSLRSFLFDGLRARLLRQRSYGGEKRGRHPGCISAEAYKGTRSKAISTRRLQNPGLGPPSPAFKTSMKGGL